MVNWKNLDTLSSFDELKKVKQIDLVVQAERGEYAAHGRELHSREVLRIHGVIVAGTHTDITHIERQVGESLRIRELQAEPFRRYIHQRQARRDRTDDIFLLTVLEIKTAAGIQD